MASSGPNATKTMVTAEKEKEVLSSTVPTNTALNTLEKFERPLCHGNACSCCGKCCDWYYDGDIDRDYERHCRDECHDIYNEDRWHRRPDGPSVTCSYFYHYHVGETAASRGFDICRCK
ncbi:unnamed protein product [Adineta ricciae]|uniref:Uncharacterized protein n=1 Tax=Adineta ricciae TaxID=249248 RepID=A0A815EUW1_ADIRI|nr:unnamed protein product [Adineta ricciae]CAF1328173.1 unnamed protein product [Adineta ricciae]